MIEFSEKDFQLTRIRRESKLFNLQTAQPFRIYGLMTKGNPLIHISYNYDTVGDNFDDNMAKLVDFCKENNIELNWESGGGTPKVCIGLRRDLREAELGIGRRNAQSLYRLTQGFERSYHSLFSTGSDNRLLLGRAVGPEWKL